MLTLNRIGQHPGAGISGIEVGRTAVCGSAPF